MYTYSYSYICQKEFRKIILVPLVFLFGPTMYVYSRQAWQHAKRFLFCSPTFNLFQTFSVRELKYNWKGAGKKKKCGFFWSRVTGNRDKLLAAEFEGVSLEIWGSIVECVLSVLKKYKLSPFWPFEPCRHKQIVRYCFMVWEFAFLYTPNLY